MRWLLDPRLGGKLRTAVTFAASIFTGLVAEGVITGGWTGQVVTALAVVTAALHGGAHLTTRGNAPDPTPPVGLFHVEGPTGPLAPLPPAAPAPSAGDQLLSDLLEGGD